MAPRSAKVHVPVRRDTIAITARTILRASCSASPPATVPAVSETPRSPSPPMRRVLYYLYERRLLRDVRHGPVPRHIGIILDGNRRYARQQRLADPREVYTLGARKLDALIDWCAGLGIP